MRIRLLTLLLALIASFPAFALGSVAKCDAGTSCMTSGASSGGCLVVVRGECEGEAASVERSSPDPLPAAKLDAASGARRDTAGRRRFELQHPEPRRSSIPLFIRHRALLIRPRTPFGTGVNELNLIPLDRLVKEVFQMHLGNWATAILMIVIASWLFYRYLAPKHWRDWSRAGLVQAFLIALYAEMYGFPVTLYVLAKLGVDLPFVSNNLWSNLIGPGESGMVVAMLAGTVFLVIALFLLAQGWRTVYRATKEKRLATEGVYSVVRHPQYTGIFLALFGEGVVHWPTIFSVALFPVIVAAYVLLARKEERRMIDEHGEAYRAYRAQVPMFFPRRGEWRRLFGAMLGTSAPARTEVSS